MAKIAGSPRAGMETAGRPSVALDAKNEMIELDGTENKGRAWGANAIFGRLDGLPPAPGAKTPSTCLFTTTLAGGGGEHHCPLPMMNILNGRSPRRINNVDFQEFMVMARGAAPSFSEAASLGRGKSSIRSKGRF